MKMQHILTISLLTLWSALWSSQLQSAPISVGNINDIYIADQLLGTSSSASCETTQNQTNCDFLKTGPTTYLNEAGVEQVVTSNPASYLLAPFKNSAYIDLGFNGVDIYNGAGNDLVIFIVGHSTSFGLDVFDINSNLVYSTIYNISTPAFDPGTMTYTPASAPDMVFDNDGNWLCVNGAPETCAGGSNLSAAFFDLGENLAGNIALGGIRIRIGEDYKGDDGTRPRFSLAGGFHTEAVTAVPVPASFILFSSGLALLGLMRRKQHHTR